jgi:chromosome segregation ATPase
MSIRSKWMLAFAASLVLAGCANQQEPATKALEAAQAALGAVREEASQFAPEQLKAVEEALERTRGQLAAGKYSDVLTAAPMLTQQIGELRSAASEGKARLEAAMAEAKELWPSLSADLPKMADALKARLEALGKMKTLPEGVDAANLDFARKSYEELSTEWTAAQADFAAGNFTDAASKANSARRRATDLMARLKVQPKA